MRSARRITQAKKPGAILIYTPEPARVGLPLLGGIAPAWAALDAICRSFSAEFPAYGLRVVCRRSTGLPEIPTIEIVFGIHAKVLGIEREAFQRFGENTSHTRRSTTLKEPTNAAVFLVSDLAAGMTGTVANFTAGRVSD